MRTIIHYISANDLTVMNAMQSLCKTTLQEPQITTIYLDKLCKILKLYKKYYFHNKSIKIL